MGTILRSGQLVQRFSQGDINNRFITYKPLNSTMQGWVNKDWFQFVVSCNGSTKPIVEEYRFRISITYAALPANRISHYVPLQNIIIGRGA